MRLLVALIAWAVLAGGPARAEVVVFAPGGMASTMEELAQAAAKAGTGFKLVVGHSPGQARQIVDGAPADLFISADPQWMAFLQARALLAEGPSTLASTRLLLIARADSRVSYAAQPGESLAAVLGDGRLAIGDPFMLPAGRFARAALEKLGVWASVENRLAPLPDVRAVVALVERGEAPAGICFAIDAVANPRIRVVAEFPPEVAPPVDFPMAILANHQRPEVTRLYDFLRGPESRAVLLAHGFSVPSP